MAADDTKFVRPGLPTRIFNAVMLAAQRVGISVAGSRTLTVVGRKSGQPRTTPVNPLVVAGFTYIVAPRGTTHWVRNLREAGEGDLTIGRKSAHFTAVEVPDHEKLPILRSYLVKWAWEVGMFFDLPKNPSDDAIKGIAHLHPIFRIQLDKDLKIG